MRFGFDDEQLALRDAVAALLGKGCGTEVVRAAWDAGGMAPARPVWRQLGDMGILGLLAPESAGGSGADLLTLALVLAETGRAALPGPLVETAAVAVPALVAAGDPSGVLPQVAAGELVVTAALGDDRVAPAASTADLFLLPGLRLATRDQVDIEPLASVDRTRDLGRVTARQSIALDGDGAFDRGAVATAAQLVGLGREMVRTTVEYVSGRQQFGVPVGSFQAVKHHLADAWTALEFAAPTVWYAAHAVDTASEARRAGTAAADAARAVSLAKAMASDAGDRVARLCLQCHGAMGYTDEYHLHMWMKRAWALAGCFGPAAWHRDRIGRLLEV